VTYEIEVRTESSDESFDRMSFAHRALDLIAPKRTTVAVCEGIFNVRIEIGRQWPDDSRWAMIFVPPKASRRSIALALAELADTNVRRYVLDVLLNG